jgi:hypothetical protein
MTKGTLAPRLAVDQAAPMVTHAERESVRDGTGHWHRIRRNLLFARARELLRC